MRFAAVVSVVALAFVAVACGEKEEPEPATPTEAADAPGGGGGPAGGNAGDGGGGGGDAGSDAKRIEAAIQEVVGGADPATACDELVTARYVRSAYGDEQGCRAAVADQPSFDVEVRGIEIEGPTAGFDRVAAATAIPESGPNRDERLEVRLVREGVAWRVDFLRSNAPPGP
jgi:hypothetical protein